VIAKAGCARGCLPVLWQLKTQSVVGCRPIHTLEAEYIACSDATREAIWFKRLAQEMPSSTLDAVEIGCDNQGALKLLETGVVQAKTEHIDVKYHHTRDEGFTRL
jgi:hypothetical protein